MEIKKSDLEKLSLIELKEILKWIMDIEEARYKARLNETIEKLEKRW